ncbi:type VII secretion-associated serine protease mycosin [Thermocatellispora tengchongensis]|uniref:Type VII secretion-associated serine protease mycosin n=1 Tax=Thermocatellispora tengchongensis TaxID=1073253 RepID=A0A840PDJ9_9ACTN|nr:S8 family serine peptidase [Thermocatellispora tengchongensis]MBB5139484.1 type VII secretion-associated serine protease mycosin [Thermocatellispora tengchongensis]
MTPAAARLAPVLCALVCLAIAVPASCGASPARPGDLGAWPGDDIGTTARAQQWPLRALEAEKAWRRSQGEGVVVAVLDTGVNPRHPDLAGVVTQGPDLTGGRRDSRHWGHHGTAMASLIAGRGHGPGRERGVLGIAPAAEILSIRVTLENDDPLRSRSRPVGSDALARGIRYAADHGADVISMSLGGGSGTWEGSAAEEEAVQYALRRGAVLVASSGNDGAGANRKNFPAAYPGVIAVGAVDERLRITSFSNRQPYVSVTAPGARIVSADGTTSYVVGDGTSSAAALVAGVAALIRAEYPALRPAQVRRAIEQGVTRRPAASPAYRAAPDRATRYGRFPGHAHDPAYGHGVVNAALALREAARIARRAGAPAVPGTTAAPPRQALPAVPGGADLGRMYFGGGPAPVESEGSRPAIGAALVMLTLAMAATVVIRSRRR